MRVCFFLAIFGCLFIETPSLATEVDFSTPLVDFDGNQMREPASGDTAAGPFTGTAVTVGRSAAAALALSREPPDYFLATRLYGGGKVELTAEETKRVKDAVAKAYSAIVSGQVWKIVDPASVK